ncbi:hypothetical protein Cob_v006837 [Colletotrichum orbiculare MAFF 240422]|uniref:Uncharacterized protein n=1 Tax=Colletotrichum orbiculare (strain 104-T / ATCC 96160 / CBS 514.97 / LARS 414 / MAFF 240422) TaxID=1213857 RepID=A0A484FRQ3_COLOR|nr:hypothetical protein Cob_v006837 [Colletotrichum orbiculare MAFF 240422]
MIRGKPHQSVPPGRPKSGLSVDLAPLIAGPGLGGRRILSTPAEGVAGSRHFKSGRQQVSGGHCESRRSNHDTEPRDGDTPHAKMGRITTAPQHIISLDPV